MFPNDQSNLIKPSGANHAVQIPVGATTQGGMGGQPASFNNADPLTAFRGAFERMTTGGASAGIQWDQYSKGGSLDSGMQEILASSGPDQDSMAYQASLVVQSIGAYINMMTSMQGKFYEVYRAVVESFRRNEMGHACPVREAFVTVYSRHREFMRPVVMSSAPLFGYRLIKIKQETQLTDLTPNHYFQAAEIALRNILFLEMVSWLVKTPEGNVHARQLPKDLADKMPKLGGMIETVDMVNGIFGLPNAYANLKFELKAAVRDDLAPNRFQNIADQLYQVRYADSMPVAPEHQKQEVRDLYDTVSRNARKFRGDYSAPVEADREVLSQGGYNWNKVRNDLANLNPRNKDEFQLIRYFHNIGKPNHYLITETDWKQIQRAFVKHPEMKVEQTVMPGCFRIVIIDLDIDNGWFSTIVRAEDYDMATVLTDPSKLLPLLESAGDMMQVKITKVDEVAGKSLEVPDEMCRKLEAKDVVPTIIIKEEIAASSSKELEATMNAINKRVSVNFKGVNAVSFAARTWDTFSCANAADKKKLFEDLPFLFKDSEMQTHPSLKQACQILLRYFKQNHIDGELMAFIDTQLTNNFNNYLINSLGFDSFPSEPGYLSVTSLIKDFPELDHHLEQNDPKLYELFKRPGDTHYLGNMLKLFVNEPGKKAGEEDKELSAIEQIRYEQELGMERNLHVIYINQRGGPFYKDPNVPIQLKKSVFPEYFDLVEKSFEETLPKQPFDTTDKILRFSDSESLWLFTYSEVDNNMATLRHISRRNPLVLLEVD